MLHESVFVAQLDKPKSSLVNRLIQYRPSRIKRFRRSSVMVSIFVIEIFNCESGEYDLKRTWQVDRGMIFYTFR